MAKEFFKDLPDTSTPLEASRINGLLDGEEALGSIVVDDVSCKNLASFGYGSTTTNQVTTIFDNSSFKINGTANASGFSFQKVICTLPAGTYTLSTKLASGSKSGGNFQLSLVSGSTEYAIYNSNITDKTTTFTLTEETSLTFRLYINNTNSMTFNNMVLNVQIEKGSTDTNFVPCKKIIKEQGGCVKEDTTFYANDYKSRNLLNVYKTTSVVANTFEYLADDWVHFVNTAGTAEEVKFASFDAKPNTTYAITLETKEVTGSPYVVWYQYNGDTLVNTSYATASTTKTTGGTTNKIVVGLTTSGGSSAGNYKIRIIVTEGNDIITPYTSYKGFGYETGNNSNGSYIKYDDGTMICYGNYSMSTTCSTALTNGGYRNSGGSTSLRVTYPQEFISAPSVTTTTTSLNCIGCKPDSPSTTYFTALFVTINSESSATTKTANYVAIGRWK